MKESSKDDFQIEFSFQGIIENIRQFSGLGRSIVQHFWPDQPDLAFEVELCLTEALSNALIHAHSKNSRKRLGYMIEGNKEKLCVSVYDQGRGFSLERAIQKYDQNLLLHHGRGLMIIQNLVDQLHYKTGKERNQLVFEKRVCTETVEE